MSRFGASHGFLTEASAKTARSAIPHFFMATLRESMSIKSQPGVLAIATLAGFLGSIAPACLVRAQDPSWSPYRDDHRSAAQINQKVRKKQIQLPTAVLPDPVRLDAVKTAEATQGTLRRLQYEQLGEADSYIEHPGESFLPRSPSHQVIRSPLMQAKQAPSPSRHLHGSPSGHPHLAKKLPAKQWLQNRAQPSQASIPGATERATWKQPYSYGYFGSSSSRHWGKHHGYRDRYTEYRFR